MGWVSKAVRRMGRPFWRRIRPIIYTRIDWRIWEYVQRNGFGGDSNPALQQLVPSFLNAVSTVQTYGRELNGVKSAQSAYANETAELEARLNARLGKYDGVAQRVDQLSRSLGEAWDRIEFVRREIMFEMRYAQSGTQIAGPRRAPVEARILSPEKVASAQADGGLRLNLGSGHIPLDRYVNVDMREVPNVDIVAEVGALPFEPHSITEITSAHLLEHFPQEELIRRLLPYWQSLLIDGGRFHAITPDGAAMLAGVADGSYPWEEFREVLFGSQEYEGDFHFNLLTPASLTSLLEEAGFRDVHVIDEGRRNGKCFEFEIVASK